MIGGDGWGVLGMFSSDCDMFSSDCDMLDNMLMGYIL